MAAHEKGKSFSHGEQGAPGLSMSGTIVSPRTDTQGTPAGFSHANVKGLLDAVETPLFVAERNGRVLLMNGRARKYVQADISDAETNLFVDFLGVDSREIFRELGSGKHEVKVEVLRAGNKLVASVKWLPEPDWIVVQLEPQPELDGPADRGTQIMVQELLQEREITYRNLLAAYLKLQEVNRQKTVFLASAAHELKTPLAVIKGYYDLLLTGSLGRLTDKQQDILEESKDSCERLVRLVSMFLNYSALESGKLVLQLRENDLRDCLDELAKRWSEAFQRKGVKLDSSFDPSIPTFRFDYQKVQQAAANLLDNALKHTPSGGSVTLDRKR